MSRTFRPGVSGLVETTSSARPSGSLTIVWLPGSPGEHLLERALEALETLVVRARVAEHLRRDRALRIRPELLREEAEPCELELLELARRERLRLAGDVDEPPRAIGELQVHVARLEAELLPDRERNLARPVDLARVREYGGRLLADRERLAVPVEDRPAPGRDDDRLAVLPHRHRGVCVALHRLEPERPPERDAEEDEEGAREQDDAPVRGALRVTSARARRRPSCRDLRARTRARSAQAARCAPSPTRSRARRAAPRCPPSAPRAPARRRRARTLRRRTATFTATTPARSTAKKTIQRTPPPRSFGLGRARARARGCGRARALWAIVDIRPSPRREAAPTTPAGSPRPRAPPAARASASGA